MNNPSNLYDWKDKFITYATVKYGDAGVALRSGERPNYMDGEQYEEDEEIVVPTRNTRAYEIYKTE